MATINSNLEVVLAGWIDGRRRNDLDTIERSLHPDVVWRGLREDLVCSDREHVLENIRAVKGRFPEVEGIELVTDANQVLLGVRSPDFTEMFGELLEGAIFNVFTIRDGLIVRMEEFKTREQAAEAMRAHREVDGQPSGKPASRMPPAPVRGLIPFVHVVDVQRSVAFYELLGFVVCNTYRAENRLDWAAFESGGAKLMLAHADQPVHPGQQGVLFYLYADDLRALQQHLRGHGVKVGDLRRKPRPESGDEAPRPRRLRPHDRSDRGRERGGLRARRS